MDGILRTPKVCQQIVEWVYLLSGRQQDIYSLCLTCKAFQLQADSLLYRKIIIGEYGRAIKLCRTVTSQNRYGSLIHELVLIHDRRAHHPANLARRHDFMTAFSTALTHMPNLLYLFVHECYVVPSWVFANAATRFPFQLLEATLQRTPWDIHTAGFLASQKSLRIFKLYDQLLQPEDLDDPYEPFTQTYPTGSLPALETFDGTMAVAVDVIMASPPIRNLQLNFGHHDSPELLMHVLSRLATFSKTLKGLNHIKLLDELAEKALDLISSACPDLLHLGVIALPWRDRHKVHLPLMHMHKLRSLEVGLHRWNPAPNLIALRALAMELHLYCPSLRHVVFWNGQSRIAWYSPDGMTWSHVVDARIIIDTWYNV